jgi:hypothetical protein
MAMLDWRVQLAAEAGLLSLRRGGRTVLAGDGILMSL